MKTSSILLLFALSAALICCGPDSTGPNGGGNGNGNNGNGNGENPPTEPTFANVITIFNQSCGGSDCHIGESTSGVQLNSYENVMNSEGDQYGGPIVVPGDAAASPLMDKISSDDPENGVRMPSGGPPLSDDEIALIRNWINNGAENN